MCYLGVNPDEFNPRILYTLKRKFTCENVSLNHFHDFVSLIFIHSGSCSYTVDDILYPVKKGDLIICNPGVRHEKRINTGDEIVEFHIGVNNLSLEGLPPDCLISREAYPVIFLGKYEQEFFRCCSEIFYEQEKGEPGYELMLKSLVMRLIVLVLKAMHIDDISEVDPIFSFENYDKTAIVSSITAFINENYIKNISLNKISRNMYLSPVYISKIFKEEVGDSPINYLIKVRLSKARELLEEGRMSIKSISKSVGYEDAYHFSKLFKKYYGTAPSRWSKQ